MLTAIEQIDPVASIRHDAGLAQGPAGRKFGPIFHQFIVAIAIPSC